MSDTPAASATVLMQIQPASSPADAASTSVGINIDPALKKKKKLLNGVNIKFTFPSGATYEGSFKDGKIEGYGVYTYGQTGDVYDGEWKADLKHGHGTYKFANGDRYVGQWYMGNKHGKGQFIFTNGDEYVGSWKDNQMNGYGAFLIASSGDRYEGYWKAGLRQGQGSLYYGNGDLYDGEWDGGHQQDLGVFYQSNGDLYCGEWSDGAMDGKGVLREKGIVFLVEYVGGYLISKIKFSEDVDEIEEDWEDVYEHYLNWIGKRESDKTKVSSTAEVDKLRDELDAAHADNSILRRRLEAAMQLLQSKPRNAETNDDASSSGLPLASKEAVAADYWRNALQKEESKTKLLECTLAERVLELQKLSHQVKNSEAMIQELVLRHAARKTRGKSRRSIVSSTDGKSDSAVNSGAAVSDVNNESSNRDEFIDPSEHEELQKANTSLLQLNAELQRKVAFLTAENAKLAVKEEAAEDQYEKLTEETAALRAQLDHAKLQHQQTGNSVPQAEQHQPQKKSPAPEDSPDTLSFSAATDLDETELRKRLVQANQLNIELRLRNGELERKLRVGDNKNAADAVHDGAMFDLAEENEFLRTAITNVKKEVVLLQSASNDAEHRLFVSTQRQAELEETVNTLAGKRSTNPQFEQVLEDKSERIAHLELENAELARLLDEAQSRADQKETTTANVKPKHRTSAQPAETTAIDDTGTVSGGVADSQKEVKKLQKRVKKVTAERNAVAEQYYDSQVQLARAHRVLGAMQGNLLVFASLSDTTTGNAAPVESVVKIDQTDPSKIVLTDCGEDMSYEFDYCFDKDAAVVQLFDEMKDALGFVWSGYQFGLLTVGELRSGKTALVTQLFPLIVQSLFKAAEEDVHRPYFSFTYRVAVVEVSSRGGFDCASEESISEISYDANGYVFPRNARFIDCTSVSVPTIVENLLAKRRQHYNGRSHTWIQLQCIRTGFALQSQVVGRVTIFDWCGPGSLSAQKMDIESARFANASSQMLKEVTTALAAKQAAVPYVKSFETALLFDVLGGNSLTAVVGKLRPSVKHVEESIKTLGILSALSGARNGPLLQDHQTCDEIRWRGIVGALSSEHQAERELKPVENTREF